MDDAWPSGSKQGKFEACGNEPRSLVAIDSGQLLCHTCLREIRPSRRSLATESALSCLRGYGLNVPDDLSREESNRLLMLYAARFDGHVLPDDIGVSIKL